MEGENGLFAPQYGLILCLLPLVSSAYAIIVCFNQCFLNTDGAVVDSIEEAVTITNNKVADVDTGIALDSLPYVLLLAVSVVGMAAFVMKKRAEREF